MDKNKFCCETENLTFQFLAMSSSKLAITDESKTNAEPELYEKNEPPICFTVRRPNR